MLKDSTYRTDSRVKLGGEYVDCVRRGPITWASEKLGYFPI